MSGISITKSYSQSTEQAAVNNSAASSQVAVESYFTRSSAEDTITTPHKVRAQAGHFDGPVAFYGGVGEDAPTPAVSLLNLSDIDSSLATAAVGSPLVKLANGKWGPESVSIDLSNYFTKAESDARFAFKAHSHDYVATSAFNAHTGDTTKHISSAERVAWNAKEGALGNPDVDGKILASTAAGVRSWVNRYVLPVAAAAMLGGVMVGANINVDAQGRISVAAPYSHPASHPASMIDESATRRFLTDTERLNWNDSYDKRHTHGNKANIDSINQNLSQTSNVKFNDVIADGSLAFYGGVGSGSTPVASLLDLLDIDASISAATTGTPLVKLANGKWGAGSVSIDLSNYYNKSDADARYAFKLHSHDYVTTSVFNGHTHSFASLTGRPTTLGGYGITDAAASGHDHTAINGVSIGALILDNSWRAIKSTGFNLALQSGDGNHTFRVGYGGGISYDGYQILDASNYSSFASPVGHAHSALYNGNTFWGDSNSLIEDYKLSYTHLVLTSTSNLFPVVNNANAIISIATHSGGYNHQLGFSSNGNIYSRNFSAGLPATSWRRLVYADMAQFNTAAYVDDSLVLHSGNYHLYALPLSGGNLTAALSSGRVPYWDGSAFANTPVLFSSSNLYLGARTLITDWTNSIQMGQWDEVNNRIEGIGRPLYITSYTGGVKMGYAGNVDFTIDSTRRVNISGGLEINNSQYGLRLNEPGYGYWNIRSVYSQTNSDLIFSSNGTERWRVHSNGYFGIGTDIARAAIDLGSTYGLPKLYLYDDGTYVNGFGIYANEFRSFFDTINATLSRMTWGKQTLAGSFTEFMRLTKDGNFDIGFAGARGEKCAINGSVYAASYIETASYLKGTSVKLGTWEIKENASGELEFVQSGVLKFKGTSAGLISQGELGFYS